VSPILAAAFCSDLATSYHNSSETSSKPSPKAFEATLNATALPGDLALYAAATLASL